MIGGCLEERGPVSRREVVYWHHHNERSTVQRGVSARREPCIRLIEKLRRTLLRSLPVAFAIATVLARGIAGTTGQAQDTRKVSPQPRPPIRVPLSHHGPAARTEEQVRLARAPQ